MPLVGWNQYELEEGGVCYNNYNIMYNTYALCYTVLMMCVLCITGLAITVSYLCREWDEISTR